jgi:hypothetical protein
VIRVFKDSRRVRIIVASLIAIVRAARRVARVIKGIFIII